MMAAVWESVDLRVNVPVSGLESSLDGGPDLVGLSGQTKKRWTCQDIALGRGSID